MATQKRNFILITISPNGKIKKHVQKDPINLRQIQEAVGGYIECVPHFTSLSYSKKGEVTTYSRGICYCNEEGKLRGLPVNLYATMAWENQYDRRDVLVGTIAFTGRTFEECTC